MERRSSRQRAFGSTWSNNGSTTHTLAQVPAGQQPARKRNWQSGNAAFHLSYFDPPSIHSFNARSQAEAMRKATLDEQSRIRNELMRPSRRLVEADDWQVTPSMPQHYPAAMSIDKWPNRTVRLGQPPIYREPISRGRPDGCDTTIRDPAREAVSSPRFGADGSVMRGYLRIRGGLDQKEREHEQAIASVSDTRVEMPTIESYMSPPARNGFNSGGGYDSLASKRSSAGGDSEAGSRRSLRRVGADFIGGVFTRFKSMCASLTSTSSRRDENRQVTRETVDHDRISAVEKAIDAQLSPHRPRWDVFEIDQAQLDRARAAMKRARGTSDDEVLIHKFRIQIKRKDLQKLHGLQWLNDEICNFYLEMISDRNKRQLADRENLAGATPLNVHFFSSFFYPMLKQSYTRVRTWTRKFDLFQHDMIIIPVHLGQHWTLATINMRQKEIVFYDSMSRSGHEDVMLLLWQYLDDEHKDKKKTPFDYTGWRFYQTEVPQQGNCSDCGVFMLRFADCVAAAKTFDFAQTDMKFFRERIACEILQGELFV